MVRFCHLILFVGLLSCLIAIGSAYPTGSNILFDEKAYSQKYAILVGLADYPGTDNDLPSTSIGNDITGMKNVLIGSCGFSQSNVYILKDSSATKASVNNMISLIAQKATSNDLVIFYFTGHGTHGQDISPFDESDGIDEYIVVYDGNIRDDELKDWCDRIYSKNTVLVIDSCFSGGIAVKDLKGSPDDSGFIKYMPLENYESIPTIENPVTNNIRNYIIDDLSQDFSKDLSRSNYLVLMACSVTESSYFHRNYPNSAFTYYFIEGLRKTTADTNGNYWISAEEAFTYALPLARLYATTPQTAQIFDPSTSQVELNNYGSSPAPTITSLTPSSATAGGSAFTLTVNGNNYVSGSKVRWNGYDRTTTFVSATQLKASIQASDIANAGTATVTVINPDGKTSGGMAFTITGGLNPTITSLTPSSATAGGSAFTLTVNGNNYVSGSKVRWNGYDRTTTFVSATQLKASIQASDIANAGTATVTVINPDGKTSGGMAFTITGGINPTITSLSPSSAIAGGSAFTLTVNGNNYVSGSKVRWNGYDRTTTFVSATQLKASIQASDIANAGSATVTVYNPDGRTSGGMAFTITGGINPTITSLSPSSAIAGGSAFTLTVNGNNYVSGSKVRWNGYDRTTTFVSATQLKASIQSSDIANAGSATVTVYNPDGRTSGGMAFTIQPSGDCTQQSFNGNIRYGSAYHSFQVPEGATSLRLTLIGTYGSNYNIYIRKDYSPSQYSYSWAGTSSSPNEDVTITNPTGGIYHVLVKVMSGSGGPYTLDVRICGGSRPGPTITSLSPSSATAGGSPFTLTVNGNNYVSGSKVRWNGYDRTTTFVSATQLKASIQSSDIANAGTATVTVYNPDGRTSGGMAFTITGGINPTITSLTPTSATAGGSAFTLTVNGNNYVSGSKVRWNGYDRTTTFVSATQLKASIQSSDIANAGTATVSVYNPDGRTSNGIAFSITQAAQQQKYALLVGIADYQSSSDLPSAYIKNDIESMNTVLVQKCGFSQSNVRILQDSQASKTNIKNALSELSRKATDKDLVVFYYSGNGRYGTDVSPIDESDYRDEYLTTYGSSAYTNSYDIRDDELKDWCNMIAAKNIILIIDAGFSGGMTKSAFSDAISGQNGNKSIPPLCADENENWIDTPDRTRDDFEKDLSGQKFLVLMACDARETCGFHKIYTNSAFTYYIVQGLKTTSADTNRNLRISAEEAFWYAKPLARNNSGTIQNAQMYDGDTSQQVEMSSY